MASGSSSNPVDVQELVATATRLELKALSAALEYLQVWIRQAGVLSSIASDTLQAIHDKNASVSSTARRLSDFGGKNADVFADLTSRLNKSYFNELGRLTTLFESKRSIPETTKKAALHKSARAKKPTSKATLATAPKLATVQKKVRAKA